MKLKRIHFVILWCLLSGIGLFFADFNTTVLGIFLLGFHTPRDCLYYIVLYGVFSDNPGMVFICCLLLITFIALWIISIINYKKGILFEYLIVVDSLIALSMFIVAVLLCNVYFFEVWYIAAGLLIKCVLFVALLLSYNIHKRKNLIDDSKDLLQAKENGVNN